tara:strand:- start:1999 stop:2346 length:348 start_codon:yes stop_codon:yes gene_type:complete
MTAKTRKLTATTPVGTFTRRTARTYSHVIVKCSPAAKEESRRLYNIRCAESWLEQEKSSEKKLNLGYYQKELDKARAVKPITQDCYYAVSWAGRPELVAGRLKEYSNSTAYPVDA